MTDSHYMLENAKVNGDTLLIDLWYPRNDDFEVKQIQIGLMDVRAADDIRVSYDFDRNGWVIQQASVFEWEPDDTERDEGWTEVAFVKAWSQQQDRPGCS
jgi:hypothetical protein